MNALNAAFTFIYRNSFQRHARPLILLSALLLCAGLVATLPAAAQNTAFRSVTSPHEGRIGERATTASIDLDGASRDQVRVYVVYDNLRQNVEAAQVTRERDRSTADARCQPSGEGRLACRVIFPHEQFPQPNREDSFPHKYAAGDQVFFRWVRETRRGSAEPAITRDVVREFIMPRPVTIALAGDSYISGQGAPDRPLIRTAETLNGFLDNGMANQFSDRPMWTDIPCHRSEQSGQARAVAAIRRQHADVAFQTINVSCDGAQILNLLSDGQSIPSEGTDYGFPMDPGRRRLPRGPVQQDPQLAAITQWLQREGHERLDVLVLSIGGNDAGFGSTATACLLGILKECRENDDLRVNMRAAANNLPRRFEALAREIAELEFGRVLITTYPDPTRGTGGLCHTFSNAPIPFDCWGVLEASISKADMEFIRDELLGRINNSIRRFVLEQAREAARERAAGRQYPHWELLDGVEAGNHGLCNCERSYFNTAGQSDHVQGDLFGSIHPNRTGHREMYEPVIHAALEQYVKEGRGPASVRSPLDLQRLLLSLRARRDQLIQDPAFRRVRALRPEAEQPLGR